MYRAEIDKLLSVAAAPAGRTFTRLIGHALKAALFRRRQAINTGYRARQQRELAARLAKALFQFAIRQRAGGDHRQMPAAGQHRLGVLRIQAPDPVSDRTAADRSAA